MSILDLLLLLLVAAVLALAVRSLWKARKKGSGCGGNCAGCPGCGYRR